MTEITGMGVEHQEHYSSFKASTFVNIVKGKGSRIGIAYTGAAFCRRDASQNIAVCFIRATEASGTERSYSRCTLLLSVSLNVCTRDGLTCAGHQAVPEQQVLHGGCPIERSGIGVIDGEGQRVGDVIVKILANARKITDDRHTHRVELLPRPYAAV